MKMACDGPDVFRHVAYPLLSLPLKAASLSRPVADLAAPPMFHSVRAKFGHERDERTVALSHLRVEQGWVISPLRSVDVVTVAPCLEGFLHLAVVLRWGVEGWAACSGALWARRVRSVLLSVRGVRGARGPFLFSTLHGGGWHPSVLFIFAGGFRTRLGTRGLWGPTLVRRVGPGWCRNEGKTVPGEAPRGR